MEKIEIYTPEQAAEILSVGAQTVRDWLRTGELKGSKVGPRLWRITGDSIREFVKCGRKDGD